MLITFLHQHLPVCGKTVSFYGPTTITLTALLPHPESNFQGAVASSKLLLLNRRLSSCGKTGGEGSFSSVFVDGFADRNASYNALY
jgi:hypothetical protein